MTGSYSEEVYALLERAGEHRARTGDSHPGWLLCFQNRKWLLRPSHAGQCLWASINDGGSRHWLRKVRWLLGIRLIRLHSQGRMRWWWARVRDKEHKKVSFFDPVGHRKRIYWADRRDFDREISVQRHFAAHGVDTVPFDTCDESRLLAEQPFIGSILRHADTLSPIDAQLLEYVVQTARPCTTADYVARVARIAGSSGPEADAFGTASRRLARFVPQAIAQFPTTVVHGDLSRQNILRHDDGKAYLIDFDRSFEASAYYDFVFAGLFTAAFGLENARRCVAAINERLVPAIALTPDDALEYALALFVLDNIVYLSQQRAEATDKAFTRKVMSLALRALQAREGPG
jgi:hypothetical protein